ncbi:nucleotide sugar dehydrogenase [Xanthomonas hortorum]|uniref:UDP-glucose 6-dehydrogenase n=2 Tax=Xanthomonas TaxID=338 RepID=A0A9X4BVK6_9XANT|nr:nucleotide sugar dehydrogenase [Xanthomonas hortorum]MDC8640429.1 nucleotide sugar dehydrogenase [Xanthomonas hortorum pv. hederae]
MLSDVGVCACAGCAGHRCNCERQEAESRSEHACRGSPRGLRPGPHRAFRDIRARMRPPRHAVVRGTQKEECRPSRRAITTGERMKVGFVGLGKLGLPCAVAMADKGHDVMGYDCLTQNMSKAERTYRETGPDGRSDFNQTLRDSNLRFCELKELAEHSDVIFVAVQTPHLPEFEGISRIGEARADFDYTYLCEAMRGLAAVIERDTIVVVISTVLPGTMRNVVVPLINARMKLVYNPFFIAMGTTIVDFLNPEFVLLGAHDPAALDTIKAFYAGLVTAPVHATTLENAELIKLLYNTYIGMKIVFANVAMEICHKTPNTDVDDVVACLALANRRLISDKYLSGGMGDGGGCHPRDNIAMSWYARKTGLSFDWFENVMQARESQTRWLADLMQSYRLPLTILGYAYKEETNITTGSAAILLKNLLEERKAEVLLFDPYVDADDRHIPRDAPRVYLIGCRHAALQDYHFISGSVVLDPWRYLRSVSEGVEYRPIGIGVG